MTSFFFPEARTYLGPILRVEGYPTLHSLLVVNTALSRRRFWLQFSAEDGPGPGSAITIDNISFSMDCFLACEY